MADDKTISLPKQASKEIGKSGTLIFQGIINREEYNSALTGARLIQKVERMRRSSSTVRATLLVVKLPILSADWKMQPATDLDGNVSPEDEHVSNYVQRELFDRKVNFFDFLRQGTTMLDFGYSVFEKVHDMTQFEGKEYIGLEKLAFRKQNTIYKWEMEHGEPGITQQISDGNTFYIPRNKLVIFTNDKEGDNYEGISLLRYAYKDWDMLDKLTIINAVALEKMGVGIPITTARENQTPTPTDLEKAEEVLRNFRANEEGYMNLPATMTIEMLDMKASTTKEIIPTLNYHDRRISQAILAQFMDIGGSSGSGAQALAKDLTSLFMKSEEATAKTLKSAIEDDVIKPLCDLNFSSLPNGYPKLTFGTIGDDDLTETANSLASLAEKKLLTPDLDLEGHLRKQYRLPAMSKEARKAYEESQKIAQETAKNLLETGNGNNNVNPEDGKGKPAPANPSGKTDLPPAKGGQKTNPKDVKAALDSARAARGKLLDVVVN